jgi:hypothetical protein
VNSASIILFFSGFFLFSGWLLILKRGYWLLLPIQALAIIINKVRGKLVFDFSYSRGRSLSDIPDLDETSWETKDDR